MIALRATVFEVYLHPSLYEKVMNCFWMKLFLEMNTLKIHASVNRSLETMLSDF
jgi:hypothetical protein